MAVAARIRQGTFSLAAAVYPERFPFSYASISIFTRVYFRSPASEPPRDPFSALPSSPLPVTRAGDVVTDNRTVSASSTELMSLGTPFLGIVVGQSSDGAAFEAASTPLLSPSSSTVAEKRPMESPSFPLLDKFWDAADNRDHELSKVLQRCLLFGRGHVMKKMVDRPAVNAWQAEPAFDLAVEGRASSLASIAGGMTRTSNRKVLPWQTSAGGVAPSSATPANSSAVLFLLNLNPLRPLNLVASLGPLLPTSWHMPRRCASQLALNVLSPSPGSRQRSKRLGRGIGSGKGKTAGRGHKGQKARSGGKPKIGFEGGQTPLRLRLPKRGFHNPFSMDFQVVNLKDVLQKIEEGAIDPNKLITMKTLKDVGLGGKAMRDGVKLLARGADAVGTPLHFEVSRVSNPAKAAVVAAGGSVTRVHYNALSLRALLKPQWFVKKRRLLPRPARPPPRLLRLVDAVGRLPAPTELPESTTVSAPHQ